MSLYKRGETWWVSFTAPDGQRIRCSARTADKQLAKEYEVQLAAKLWRIHRLGEKPRRMWQEATVQWLREKEHKKDIRQDRSKLKWLHHYFGHLYLDEITRDLISEVAEAKKLDASPATANRYLALIRSIFRIARDEWEWLDTIPVFRLFPEPQKRVRWLTKQEAARLLTELPDHLAELAALTLATGLRQRNASFLTWAQVDLKRGMAWIHGDESKSGKAFPVPLNDDAISVIARRVGEHPTYVFTYRGKPVARTSTKAWYAALKRAGIEDFRWHDLRHTWASWHAQSGTSTQELQELGGWSCTEMVQRYAHLGGDHLKKAASRISGTNLAQSVKYEGLRLIVSR
jgi:integrase